VFLLRNESVIRRGLVNTQRVRHVLTVIGAGLLASVLLFPPFMVIDLASAGTRHAALGHHARWSPPTPVMAERALTEMLRPPPAGVQTSLRIGVNRVRLGLELTAAAVGVLAVWVVQRWHRRRSR